MECALRNVIKWIFLATRKPLDCRMTRMILVSLTTRSTLADYYIYEHDLRCYETAQQEEGTVQYKVLF